MRYHRRSRRFARLRSPATAAFTAALVVTTLTGCARLRTPHPPVVVVSLQHSVSDAAEEPIELAALTSQVIPPAAAKHARVIVFTAGAAGFTSPRVLANVDLETRATDGGNQLAATHTTAVRTKALVDAVSAGLARVPLSLSTDVFGAARAAASFVSQFPGSPATYVAFGDGLATTPTGCVLGLRDLAVQDVTGLLHTCSPEIPDLRGVDVALAGAGYSLDSPIPTATAEGLERFLRTFYARTGATVTLYGPVDLSPITVNG